MFGVMPMSHRNVMLARPTFELVYKNYFRNSSGQSSYTWNNIPIGEDVPDRVLVASASLSRDNTGSTTNRPVTNVRFNGVTQQQIVSSSGTASCGNGFGIGQVAGTTVNVTCYASTNVDNYHLALYRLTGYKLTPYDTGKIRDRVSQNMFVPINKPKGGLVICGVTRLSSSLSNKTWVGVDEVYSDYYQLSDQCRFEGGVREIGAPLVADNTGQALDGLNHVDVTAASFEPL